MAQPQSKSLKFAQRGGKRTLNGAKKHPRTATFFAVFAATLIGVPIATTLANQDPNSAAEASTNLQLDQIGNLAIRNSWEVHETMSFVVQEPDGVSYTYYSTKPNIDPGSIQAVVSGGEQPLETGQLDPGSPITTPTTLGGMPEEKTNEFKVGLDAFVAASSTAMTIAPCPEEPEILCQTTTSLDKDRANWLVKACASNLLFGGDPAEYTRMNALVEEILNNISGVPGRIPYVEPSTEQKADYQKVECTLTP